MSQKGFTLVELMVGLAVSMLCMVMMLMMFKQITRAGADAARAAEYDAQLETSLLIAQKLVQNAGYGSGATDDVVVGTFGGNPALLWRSAPNLASPTTYVCEGIAEKIEAKGTLFIHQLLKLKQDPGYTCTTGNLTTAFPWVKDKTILAIKSADENPVFSYSVAGACAPFGVANADGAARVVITASRPGAASGPEGVASSVAGANVRRAICLKNILATPVPTPTP